MNYKYECTDNTVTVKDIHDFLPKHIFECGQCFRWNPASSGDTWTGIAFGKVIHISLEGSDLIIKGSRADDFERIWVPYFDLDRDYGLIKKKLRNKDSVMKEAVEFGWGIRLLRQNFWEALLSFIISQNNGIPRIKQIIESLSKNFGHPIKDSSGTYYSFPEAGALSNAGIEAINVCRGGYRCRYIHTASTQVLGGSYTRESLEPGKTDDAREYLKQLTGVGDKVADCVLLFSGTKFDIFPTDRWVLRVMQELYFNRPVSIKEIQAFSREYFGPLAGYAQQYLFYYARENRIGL